MRRARVLRRALWLLSGIAVASFAAVACLLHFQLSRLLFRQLPAPAGSTPPAFRLMSPSGNELLVRRQGSERVGCVVFFPGQHGSGTAYDFDGYVAAGLAVHVLAYPGQDGAVGETRLSEIEELADDAAARVASLCGPHRTVLVGVSLGSMLAAYTARAVQPAGLLLLSAAPSLSAAIQIRLRSHIMLAPFSLLPISMLVPHDYSLAESLHALPDVPVVILQGTRDEQTPLGLLRDSGVADGNVQLREIPGATHATAFALSRKAQLSAILDMLSRQPPTH